MKRLQKKHVASCGVPYNMVAFMYYSMDSYGDSFKFPVLPTAAWKQIHRQQQLFLPPLMEPYRYRF